MILVFDTFEKDENDDSAVHSQIIISRNNSVNHTKACQKVYDVTAGTKYGQ